MLNIKYNNSGSIIKRTEVNVSVFIERAMSLKDFIDSKWEFLSDEIWSMNSNYQKLLFLRNKNSIVNALNTREGLDEWLEGFWKTQPPSDFKGRSFFSIAQYFKEQKDESLQGQCIVTLKQNCYMVSSWIKELISTNIELNTKSDAAKLFDEDLLGVEFNLHSNYSLLFLCLLINESDTEQNILNIS